MAIMFFIFSILTFLGYALLIIFFGFDTFLVEHQIIMIAVGVACFIISAVIYEVTDAGISDMLDRRRVKKQNKFKPYIKYKDNETYEFEYCRFLMGINSPLADDKIVEYVNKGNLNVYALYAYCKIKGIHNFQQDEKKALEFLNYALDKENPNAYIVMYYLYKEGLHYKKDIQKALQWLKKALLLNSALANIEMGNFLYEQDNLNQEKYKKILSYYEKARSIDYNYGNEELANLYLDSSYEGGLSIAYVYQAYLLGIPETNGVLVSKALCMEKLGNEKKAFNFYKRAADRNDTYALCDMALHYGIKSDFNLAIDYINKALNTGDSYAYVTCGLMYQKGWLGEKNDDKAKEYLTKAANMGSGFGMTMLADLEYDIFSDYDEAEKWLIKAVEVRYSGSMKKLADHYNSVFVHKKQQAIMWYEACAEDGNVEAYTELGKIYHLDKNEAKTIKCFNEADNNHKKACMLSPILYNSMDCNLPNSSVHEILQARILE